LALLQAHGAKALVTWAPVTAARRDTVTNLERVRRRIADLSTAHGVPFVDLNERVPLDDRADYRDDDHLNQRGVDKVMPVFTQVVREHHLLDTMAVEPSLDRP
jgi:hypothetical protein